MSEMKSLVPAYYVQTSAEWQACVTHLQSVDRFALDIEANGMHAYRDSICLLQFSTEFRDIILDPLADLTWEAEVAMLLADERIEKVFHASEYDLILLKRDHDITINNLFDTMWAARIVGMERIGLANLLAHYLGVEIDKKYQRMDWRKRPLQPDQLSYAQTDTHYLLPLRDLLGALLQKGGHEEEAREIFAEACDIVLPDSDFSADGFWRINGVMTLSRRSQAVLRELMIWRNEQGKRRDIPVFFVMSDTDLLSTAQQLPQTMGDLAFLPQRLRERIGRSLLEIVAQGMRAPLPKRPPQTHRLQPNEQLRFEQLQNWRKNKAIQRGVGSDVIISREALVWLAQLHPPFHLESLPPHPRFGPWRRATYGEELIALLQQITP